MMKLTTKLIILVMGSILVVVLLYTFLVNSRVQAHLWDRQLEWVETMVMGIGESLAQETINGNKLYVVDLLKNIVVNDLAIEFAYITDMQGQLFAHTFEGGFPRFLAIQDLAIIDNTNAKISEYHTVQGKIVEMHLALIEGLPAHLHLGVNEQEIKETLRNIYFELSIGTIAIGMIALLIAVTIGKRISSPLVRFTEQLKDYDTNKSIHIADFERLDPDTRDLISTFNKLISERKKNEQELEQHRDHLEELVEKRTLELKMANKELEAFSYSVSHDLRSPLRGIDGFSLALLEDYQDKLDDEGKDYLHRVREGVQRMGALIDDLLILSRTSREQLKRTSVDLTELANLTFNQLRDEYPGRTVNTIIQTDLQVFGDANLLSVVVDNLLENAWKYTAKNLRAEIEFGSLLRDNKKVFFVRDNGTGFDMRYANKLFGAFQRLHKDKDFPGTGIGLATVQRIIHRHGGEIWAEAEVNKGATFYFTLDS